LIEISLV